MLTKLPAALFIPRHHFALSLGLATPCCRWLGGHSPLCLRILVLDQLSAAGAYYTQSRTLLRSRPDPGFQTGNVIANGDSRGHLLGRTGSEREKENSGYARVKPAFMHRSVRPASQSQRQNEKNGSASSGQIVEAKDKPFAELTVGQKVARAGKDATYTGIIVIGIGVTGLMFYAIGRELFSGQSASGVYGKALKQIKKNGELVDELGEPIKGYGEMTRRGRRRYTSNLEYEVDGVKHMRMKFYVEGPLRKGTAQLEVKQNESKRYEYRYLFVELEGYPRKTVILEDNR